MSMPERQVPPARPPSLPPAYMDFPSLLLFFGGKKGERAQANVDPHGVALVEREGRVVQMAERRAGGREGRKGENKLHVRWLRGGEGGREERRDERSLTFDLD